MIKDVAKYDLQTSNMIDESCDNAEIIGYGLGVHIIQSDR